MSKVVLLTDTHFGWSGDSVHFHKYFKRFYDKVFFPELQRRGITTIVHGGDLFDKRQQGVNLDILSRTRQDFLERLEPYETHVLVGNHDCYFKDTNHVNSVRELVANRYPLIHLYEEPQEAVIGGLRMLLVPWLNSSNMGPGLEMVAKSKAGVLVGHLEIAGFHYDRSIISKHGLDRNVFERFERVFSGHFHTQSLEGNIQYLGSPYEMTFADLADDRGFHIFDTVTLETEFIKNPFSMFHRLSYDDRQAGDELLEEDLSHVEGGHVKVIVEHKTQPLLYEKWRDRLQQFNPYRLRVDETLTLQVGGEEADEQFAETEAPEEVLRADTVTVLDKYVDAMTLDINKERMKDVMRALWMEATTVGSD